MKKSILAITLTLVGLLNLSSCSSGESMLEVTVTTAQRPVIPASTSSCLARRVAEETQTTPTADIEAAYFTIPQMTFTPQHKDKDVYISFIKITFNVPGQAETTVCTVGGDALAALKKADWYQSPTKEAKIAAGATGASLQTECPIYCGGIDKDLPSFSSTAVITVYGYEQNPSDINDAVGFTTTTYINFGKQ